LDGTVLAGANLRHFGALEPDRSVRWGIGIKRSDTPPGQMAGNFNPGRPGFDGTVEAIPYRARRPCNAFEGVLTLESVISPLNPPIMGERVF